jgi:predicted N-acetyltransferase YhbS
VNTQLDSEMIAACARPVDLSMYKILTQDDVEALWEIDRMNLVYCGQQKQALVDRINKENNLRKGSH